MPRKKSDPRENVVRKKKHTSDAAKGKSGRPRKKKTKKKRRKAQPPESQRERALVLSKSSSKELEPVQGFKWTKLRRKAVRLMVAGKNINEIAEATEKHRNTVRRWMQEPEFLNAVMVRLEEFKNSKRFLRLQTTSKTLDRITDIIDKQFKAMGRKKLRLSDGTYYDSRVLAHWLKEFRSMRAEERKDFGDHVERIEKKIGIDVRGGIGLVGIHGHKHQHTVVTLRGAIEQAFPNGAVIEAETMDEATGDLLAAAVVKTGIIDQLLEEDAIEMEQGG